MANPSPDEGVRAALSQVLTYLEGQHAKTKSNGVVNADARRTIAALSTHVPEEEPLRCTECSNLIHASEETIIGEAPMHRSCANTWLERNADAIAGLPRGTASAAEQPALVSAQDDPVRRAAYQQAMSRLANRVGLSDRFTASMRPELHQYEGSVLVGSHELLPKTGAGAASDLSSPLPSQVETAADDPLEAATAEFVAENDAAWNVIELAERCGAENCSSDDESGWSLGFEAVVALSKAVVPAEALAAERARADELQGLYDAAIQMYRQATDREGRLTVALAAAEARADRAEEALRNAKGLLDTPIARRRYAGNEFYYAAMASIRGVLDKETPHGER